jgi:DNA-binding NarL/FixJ family response regulator
MRGYRGDTNNDRRTVSDIEPIVSRILIVDDDVLIGAKIQALLADELYDTVLVKDATNGIRELSSSRFDLVIVDTIQARMDGLALIARLRGLALTLPIIGMTCAKMPELTRPSLDSADLAIEAGATCCLRWPLDPKRLLEAVSSNLAHASNNPVAKMRRDLSAVFSSEPKIAILEGSAVPRELREAVLVLREYIQKLGYEKSESEPRSLDTMRDAVTCASKATERLFLIIEPNGEMESRACETAKVIPLNNQTINLNPALQRVHSTGSPSRERLTPRELQVLALVMDGVSNKVGCFRLSISVRTFEAHRANLMGKLGAKNAAELVRFGLERAV